MQICVKSVKRLNCSVFFCDILYIHTDTDIHTDRCHQNNYHTVPGVVKTQRQSALVPTPSPGATLLTGAYSMGDLKWGLDTPSLFAKGSHMDIYEVSKVK